MDVKRERADSREVRESYTILMESDGITSHNRSLRREICISRIVIFILVITCMTFCVFYFIQQVNTAKNNENMNKEKANETHLEHHIRAPDLIQAEVQTTPLMASLSFEPPSNLSAQGEATLTLWQYNSLLDNICEKEYCETLTIPKEGTYKIGLQITYYDPRGEAKSVALAHNVTKYDSTYQGKLVAVLSIYDTVNTKSPWIKSMFSECLHFFNKGDRIQVQTKNAKYIDFRDERWTKNFLTVQFVSKKKNQD